MKEPSRIPTPSSTPGSSLFPEPASVVVKTSTWEKESYGLFDYANRSATRQTFKTFGNC